MQGENKRKKHGKKESREVSALRKVLRTIDDPFEEKRHLERKSEVGWGHYLLWKAKVPPGVFIGLAPEVEHLRIVEVYRLCYERSKGADRTDVIRDFATFFPDRILDAPWLRELVRINTCLREGKSLLRALANGFRRAARKQSPATKAELRRMHLGAARIAIENFKKEFAEFESHLDRNHADPDWIEEKVGEKAKELRDTHPNMREPSRVLSRVRSLLQKGRTYEAAVQFTAAVFHVRARDLENTPS